MKNFSIFLFFLNATLTVIEKGVISQNNYIVISIFTGQRISDENEGV